MTKFSCTMSSGSFFYYVSLIAENPQQAREMALAEATEKLQVTGSRPREWSAVVVEADVAGPGRILDSGRRNN
jgi:hypothetical protein